MLSCWLVMTGGLAMSVHADPNTLHPPSGVRVFEDRVSVSLVVTREGDLASPASLDYATSDGTARAGEDYSEMHGTLDFAAGETQKALSITLLNDGVRESLESFQVQWSHPKGASLFGPSATTTVSIVANDPGVSFEDADPLVQEDAGQITLTVRRGNDVELGPFTVDFATGNRTAQEGSDYAAVRGALSFARGEMVKTLTIPILNDGVREGSEMFSVTLGAVSGDANLGAPATRLVTIDASDPGVFLTGATVNEASPEATLVVSRGGDFDLGPFSVDYFTRDGSAKAGVDYVASSGTVPFKEGELHQTIKIPLLNDAVRETAKAFHVSLRNAVGAPIVANPAVSVSILDNDPGIHFAFDAYYAREGPSATASVTVERGIDESASAAEVGYLTSDSSAFAGRDYVETKGTLRFEAGEQSKVISIPILNDGVMEFQEEFIVTLTDAQNGTSLGFPRAVTVRIEDNDTGVSVGSASVSEGAGVVNLGVYRGNDGDFPMTVDYATQGGTALPGKDYEAVSGTLSFGPGEVSKSISVPILNDAIAETNKQFRIVLGNPTGGAALATNGQFGHVEILDDDAGPGFENAESGITVWENGGFASITVRRGTDDPQPFTVDYATQDGLARAGLDYVATRGTLRFDAGVKSMTISIPILDDLVAGTPGDIKVHLSNVTDGLELSRFTTQTIRIFDNEILPALDRPFSNGLRPDGYILALAVQPDGRMLLGGEFDSLGSVPRPRIARLLSDGTVDPSFVPDVKFSSEGNVTAMAVLPGGKILAAISYRFTGRSEPDRCHLLRLFSNGNIDASFRSPTDWEAGDEVTSIALKPSGDILVVLSYGGVQHLSSDGHRHELLTVGIRDGAAVVQPDGRALIVGESSVIRYNPDNSEDPSFVVPKFEHIPSNPNGFDSVYFHDVALQPDGKILVVGSFNRVGGLPYGGVVRLLPNGSIDSDFKPVDVKNEYSNYHVESGQVRRVIVDAGGKIWIGGHYTSVNGFPRSGLARLNGDGTLDESMEGGAFSLRGYCCGGIRSMTALASLPNGDLLIGDRSLTRLRVHAGRTVVELPKRSLNVNYFDEVAVATVERVGDLTEATTVAFSTRDDTAKAGADYVAATGSITFAPGEGAKHIRVPLQGGSSDSVGKSFLVELSQATGSATLGLRQLRFQIEAYDRAGVVDANFRPLPPADESKNFAPEAFAISRQSDGKILAVGSFFPGWWPGRSMARFNHDGTLDQGFSSAKNAISFTVLPTGKIICSGHSFVSRLNEDGSLDSAFKAVVPEGSPLYVLADQDGRIVVGIESVSHPAGPFRLVRLDLDGSADPTFTSPTFSGSSYRTALDPGGRLIVAGPSWQTSSRVIRLNRDGRVDDSFVSGGPVEVQGGATIHGLAVQNDGKILVTGRFDSFAGVSCGSVVRLNSNGAVDPDFRAGLGARTRGVRSGETGEVRNVALQPDGGIIIAGAFSHFDGVPRAGIARLHRDGTLDRAFEFPSAVQTFTPNQFSPAFFESLAIEPNRGILVGGIFDEIGGTKVHGFARLDGGLTGGAITGWNATKRTLNLATRRGRTHVLEASTDLLTWLPLRTNTATGLTLEFEDADAQNHSRRFYRARTVRP